MTSQSKSVVYLIAGAGLFLMMFAPILGECQNLPAPVQVELDPAKPFSLRVTLRSGAKNPVTLYRADLPWGNRYSMVYVAVTPKGVPLKQYYGIDDPGPDRVTVEPKSLLTGNIDLGQIFVGLDEVLKKSVVHVFWAYKAPDGLGIPQWSGGWVLIPQQGRVTLTPPR